MISRIKLLSCLPMRFRFSSIPFTFVDKDGKETPVTAEEGKSILEVARSNDIELEGACEASLACSTCHVILQRDLFDKLESPEEEEEDMLDLAYGLKPTSRLGCQIKVSEDFRDTKIQLPKATRNFYVDGHKPEHH